MDNIRTGPGVSPTYLVVMLTLWISNCYAAPHQTHYNNPQDKMGISLAGGQSPTMRDKIYIRTTTSPTVQGEIMTRIPIPPAIVDKLSQRNKRDLSDSKAQYAFPDVQEILTSNAHDANLQKFLMLLAERNTVAFEDDNDFDDYPAPIELVVGKKPGSMRSVPKVGMGSKPTVDSQRGNGNAWVAGEEPTGLPILLNRHRINKKSSISEVIPEIFLRDAATSSRTQPDPKIMRKLLARIGFSRVSRSRSQQNGRLYSVGQLLEHFSRLNDQIPAVSRPVL